MGAHSPSTKYKGRDRMAEPPGNQGQSGQQGTPKPPKAPATPKPKKKATTPPSTPVATGTPPFRLVKGDNHPASWTGTEWIPQVIQRGPKQ